MKKLPYIIPFALLCFGALAYAYFAVHLITDKGAETIISIGEKVIEMENERIKELDVLIANEYTVYLDGNEIDASTIELQFYASAIDHKTKSIFLTNKD